MNYWQFKFDMKKGDWKEFDTINRGEQFNQSVTAYKKMQNCKGDIVFYYRMDKKGIYFIAEIISDPYQAEYNTKYAIDLRIVKRLDKPFNDFSNKIYADLETRLDPMGQGASKYLFNKDDKGLELYTYLMGKTDKLNNKNIVINSNDYKVAEKIRTEHMDSGYIFNVFSNLNLIRGEVKHFAFIGNLLNPYGNHFHDKLFLKYFIQSLLEYTDLVDNELLINFIDDNPTVKIEKSISDENDKYIGRIDLWLESDNYIIAIEGKIEAKDNIGQLEKYDNYLKQQSKESLLLYLTLEKGEEPEKVKKEALSNFHLMNFEQDILDFISYSIDDEQLNTTIRNTLLDYKDALLTYMYKYHLSFEYSSNLIQEITKNKNNFEKYHNIKDYYYRNMKECKYTVIQDIAENFEYAKAKIELDFYKELKETIVDEETICKSALSLDDDISKDLYLISKARIARLQPKIDDKNPQENNLGDIEISFYSYDEDIGEDFKFSIINNAIGVIYNEYFENIDTLFLYKNIENNIVKISNDTFKSSNISKLLDKKYRAKLIQKVLEEEC